MKNVELYHICFLILATLLDIFANIFLKYSNGFKRWGLGLLSLLCVLAAFRCLAETITGMDLSIAYALWGGFGIVSTTLAGVFLFNQKLNCCGWAGIATLITGMIIVKFS